MADEQLTEPLFRANKRRKDLRKRTGLDEDDDSTIVTPNAVAEVEKGTITKQAPTNSEDDAAGVVRTVKKAGVRRHGIGFSSAGIRRNIEQDDKSEQALVPVGEDEPPELHNTRFVKPTGKVVTEDKHMTAYIDSKLAKIRSSKAAHADTNGRRTDVHPVNDVILREVDDTTASPERAANAMSGERSYQQAQAKSTRVYQRPTKRRAPPAIPETRIARESMIDQIMRESQVPIYDRTASQTPPADGEEMDNDAATAEAFKAQLLADLEQQRRRPARTNAAASTGPKLGGSRSQREKMRAMEEAKKVDPGKK